MHPLPGVTSRVFDSGWMELHRPETGTRLLCDETGTAMWIALSQESWNLGDAAVRLGGAWDEDPWEIRDMMASWLDELRRAGLFSPRG